MTEENSLMNKDDIIQTLDNIGNALFEIEIKARYSIKMAEILKALNAVRNAIDNDRKDDDK